MGQIVTELPPMEPVAVNTAGNFALRISSPFLTSQAPTISGGRHGSTGHHAKFLPAVNPRLHTPYRLYTIAAIAFGRFYASTTFRVCRLGFGLRLRRFRPIRFGPDRRFRA